jgi:para-nitrobenzyl esterase
MVTFARSLALPGAFLLAMTSCAAAGPGTPAACTAPQTEGTAEHGLCVFKGIPYAAPPVGDLRFRPPQPLARRTGTLKADDGSRVCPQFRDDSSEEYPDKREVYADEDCLTLNIWAPRKDGRQRPVIVFIHGGAARFGTANEPRYAGDRLASKGDAVVVTINYRLGVLGWTELGGMDKAYAGSGNNGLRDQMMALTWIREHIAGFGGDPRNVTAVGESEGAFSISAMLATDRPERLFRRVILQSGSGSLVQRASYKRRIGDRFPVQDIAALKSMSTTELLGLQEKTIRSQAPGVLGAVYFGPYVDGELVKGPVTDQVRKGNARKVDIMVGTTRDEVNFFGQFAPEGTADVAGQYWKRFFPAALKPMRERMLAAYRKGRTKQEATLAMFTDQALRVPATRIAREQSRWRPSYVFEFGWRPTKGIGAIHTIELPFMFGSLSFTGIPGGAEALRADRKRLTALSDQMIDAWTSFAATGDPDARRTVARPAWPAYRASRATMTWDLPPKVVNDLRGHERTLWDKVPLEPFGR